MRPPSAGFHDPSAEGRRPSADRHAQRADVRGPSIDVRRPSSDSPRPSDDRHARRADLNGPSPDGRRPRVDIRGATAERRDRCVDIRGSSADERARCPGRPGGRVLVHERGRVCAARQIPGPPPSVLVRRQRGRCRHQAIECQRTDRPGRFGSRPEPSSCVLRTDRQAVTRGGSGGGTGTSAHVRRAGRCWHGPSILDRCRRQARMPCSNG